MYISPITAEVGLSRQPGRTVPWLKKHLAPVRPPDRARLERRLAALDSKQYRIRHKAERALRACPDFTIPLLRRALDDKPSLEVRRRVERLWRQVEQDLRSPPGDRIRELRALAVLESIGSSAARDVLGTLARGAPEARLTEEAKASLRRLDKRPTAVRSEPATPAKP